MGERGGSVGAPPVAATISLPRAPLLTLALVLALLLGLAVVPQPRLDVEGAGALLLARSLASDGDRLWQVPDRARLEALTAEGRVDSEEMRRWLDANDVADGKRFGGGPLVYGLFLAPWAALAGARGALLAQATLFACAALFAARALANHVGQRAAWLPALVLLASTSGAYLFRLWPEAMLSALLLIAFTLARGAHSRRVELAEGETVAELSQLYPLELAIRDPDREEGGAAPPPRRMGFALRWAAVGALLGAVVSAVPWMAPLLWPAAAAVPAGRRRLGVTVLLAAAGATLLGIAVGGAATAGDAPSPQRLLAALDLPAMSIPDPRVLGWDVAYMFAGRHLGLVFYAAPLLLLVTLAGRGEGRGALWGGATLSLLALLLLHPFDLAGSPLTIGLRSLVPLTAALCLAAVRAPARWALLLTFAWGAVWLWPIWRSPREPLGPAGELRYAAPYLAPWAPIETTQPRLRLGSPLRFAAGRLLLFGGEALSGGSVATVPTDRWVELLAGIRGDAPGFWVEGGEQAGNELPVRGAEVTETIFRPDGGISFLVRPRRAMARHEMPDGDREWSFYHVSVRFPGPPGKRFTVRVRPG